MLAAPTPLELVSMCFQDGGGVSHKSSDCTAGKHDRDLAI